MKNLILFIAVIFASLTAFANDLSSHEISIVKYFNSTEHEIPIEIVKPSSSTLVIEYSHNMYVIDNEVLTTVYTRLDADWYITARPNIPLYTILREYSHVGYYHYEDGGTYLIVERIDGNGSYQMDYIDSFPDPSNNATLYIGKGESLLVGPDYAIHEDKKSRTVYKLISNN